MTLGDLGVDVLFSTSQFFLDTIVHLLGLLKGRVDVSLVVLLFCRDWRLSGWSATLRKLRADRTNVFAVLFVGLCAHKAVLISA